MVGAHMNTLQKYIRYLQWSHGPSCQAIASCDKSHFYLYFKSFFPYISVPILMFSLSSCDLSLTLSLPLSWIVTMSLTSLLLCHHLWPFMMSTMRIGLASCHPFSALPYTAQPSVASLTKPSLSFPVEFCSCDKRCLQVSGLGASK